MIPYITLKMIISACPTGFPLAQNIRDVTPISDAASVRKFARSKIRNAKTVNTTETLHSNISDFVKQRIRFFILKTLHSKRHLPRFFKDLTKSGKCLSARWQYSFEKRRVGADYSQHYIELFRAFRLLPTVRLRVCCYYSMINCKSQYFAYILLIFKAIPHNYCRAVAPANFSADCPKRRSNTGVAFCA